MIPQPELAPFKELLLRACGFSFGNDRERTLQEGLEQRMGLRDTREAADYHALLRQEPAELDRLVELLTVNETYFLREPDHLNLLADHLAPERRAANPGPLRILCAGCSTGEEPYSVAMMLRDRAWVPSSGAVITGVDIDAEALAKARAATYGRHSFRGMDPDFEARHFDDAGPFEKRVKGPVREQVAFEVLNLVAPSYPPGLDQQDIILYRNVSIYFPSEVQEAIFRRLAALLKPGGYLLVGATETLYHDLGILPLVERGSLYLFQNVPFGAQERRRRPSSVPGQRPVTGLRPPAAPPLPAVRAEAPPARRLGDLLEEAQACIRSRREGAALTLLNTLLERDPRHVKAHSLKAGVLLMTARQDEARVVCEAVLALDPLCHEACLMLGIIARQKGDEPEALKRFREAIYLEPACWFAHYNQSELHLAKGERLRARTGFETALRILVSGAPSRGLFPLAFNAEEFITRCRHKLTLLQEPR